MQMYDTEEQQEIDQWNEMVMRYITKRREFHGCHPESGQNFVIEPDCYRADDSIDGFRGSWINEPGITCFGDTPFDVYIDLLDCEP